MSTNYFFHRDHYEQTVQFCLERSTSQAKKVSLRESAVDFLKNANKILVSSIKAKNQHLVKGCDFGFIDPKTTDNDIACSAEGVGRFNQCMLTLSQHPTNKAFDCFDLTVRQAIDPRGASYTSSLGDMHAYNGTSSARKRGSNTGLITPHIFHGYVGGHAASVSTHGLLLFDTAEFEDNGPGRVISFGNSGGGGIKGLSGSLFTGSDICSIVSVGSGTGNNRGRGSGDVVGITPKVLTLMLANKNSNSLTLSLDFTPPEIKDVCNSECSFDGDHDE
jgi:hypothetical protein